MNDPPPRCPKKKVELFAKLKAWQQTFPDIKYKAVKTVDEYNSGENKKEKKPKNKKS